LNWRVWNQQFDLFQKSGVSTLPSTGADHAVNGTLPNQIAFRQIEQEALI
jgi:hypothetical protein